MKKPFNYKDENLDEKIIHEIMTRRRCDYVDKRLPAYFDGSIDTWGIIKENRRQVAMEGTSQRKKGDYDDIIRRLTTQANNQKLSKKFREQCKTERSNIIARRELEVAWGSTEKRISELQRSGKIVKTLKEIRREQILDLLKYITDEKVTRQDRNVINITRDQSYNLTARLWNTLPDDLAIKDLHGKRVTADLVGYTYTNAAQRGKINW